MKRKPQRRPLSPLLVVLSLVTLGLTVDQAVGYEVLREDVFHAAVTSAAETAEVRAYPRRVTVDGVVVGGGACSLRLTRNDALFGADYAQRRVLGSGRTSQSEAHMCHYVGHVVGREEDSSVAVSTCGGGLRGLVVLGGESYWVEPHTQQKQKQQKQKQKQQMAKGRGARTVMRSWRLADADEGDEVACGVTHELMQQIMRQQQTTSSSSSKMTTQDADSKIIELLIVNDQERFKDKGDQTEINSASLVNVVKTLFTNAAFDPSITIVLAGQVTWVNGDPYSVTIDSNGEVDHRDLLTNKFHVWRRVHASSYDNAQLLTGYDLQGGTVGFANVGTMCNNQLSGGIVSTHGPRSDAFHSVTIAHEIGHNLDLLHDDEAPCSDTSQTYIMSSSAGTGSVTEFSTCSKNKIREFLKTNTPVPACLDNAATKQWGSPVCGNGFVEFGEQCDCGAANCTLIDKCCNGTSCQFLPQANCSANQPCCNASTCQLHTATEQHVCRAAASTCDVAEVCSGASQECPDDIFVGSGRSCTGQYGDSGMCHNGACKTYLGTCRTEGASFPSGPYGKCPHQSSFNRGNICGVLYCKAESSTSESCIYISSFDSNGDEVTTYMPEGVPCGTAAQCMGGQCVASSALRPADPRQWKTSEWEPCNCTDTKPTNRTVTCFDSLFGKVVDETLCPADRPADEQPCCPPPDDTPTFTIPYLDITIRLTTFNIALMAGSAVFFCVWGIMCKKCCCRSDEEREMDQMLDRALKQKSAEGIRTRRISVMPRASPPSPRGRLPSVQMARRPSAVVAGKKKRKGSNGSRRSTVADSGSGLASSHRRGSRAAAAHVRPSHSSSMNKFSSGSDMYEPRLEEYWDNERRGSIPTITLAEQQHHHHRHSVHKHRKSHSMTAAAIPSSSASHGRQHGHQGSVGHRHSHSHSHSVQPASMLAAQQPAPDGYTYATMTDVHGRPTLVLVPMPGANKSPVVHGRRFHQ